MICILASSKLQAERWAAGKLLEDDEWFYAETTMDLMKRKNFHVIITESAGVMPPHLFEKFFALAKARGRMK